MSELPLGHRLFLLLAGEVLFPPFSFVCLRVPRAWYRGRPRRHLGCRRALAGRGGVGRSAVAIFVPRRRVCIETREKHEWALPGFLMSG